MSIPASDPSGHLPILETLTVILVVAVGISYVFKRFRLPSILGYILTGSLIGPGGFGLLADTAVLQALPHVGILFLLFIIGLELSMEKIKQLKSLAPKTGSMQIILTTLVLSIGLFVCGLPIQLSILLGTILSLSSTTMVLKSLEERAEIDTVHGRLILGILVIQDLFIVPLMAMVQRLTQPFTADMSLVLEIGALFLEAIGLLLLAAIISLKLLPALLDKLAVQNNREIFILTVVAIGLGSAFLTGSLGLSYEAGAFLAGLALSGSVYSRQVAVDSRPFRDVFATLFFVFVGTMVDWHYVADHGLTILAATASIIALKTLAASLGVAMWGLPRSIWMWAGLSVFQVGEFSFILLPRVLESTEIPSWEPHLEVWSPLLIHAVILTMFMTPIIIGQIPGWIRTLQTYHPEQEPKESALPKGMEAASHPASAVPSTMGTDSDSEADQEEGTLPSVTAPLANRVIVAGYGPTAQNLCKALGLYDLPYLVVELNAQTVKQLVLQGQSAVYGDVANAKILKAAGIRSARVLALTIPDIHSAHSAIRNARAMNPEIWILARARFRKDIDTLVAAGANEVVYEELEASISMIGQVMNQLEYNHTAIQGATTVVRQQQLSLMREGVTMEAPVFGRFNLMAGTHIEWLTLDNDSTLVGKTIGEAALRPRTGITVLSIISGETGDQKNPAPDYVLQANDILVAMGTQHQLKSLEELASIAHES